MHYYEGDQRSDCDTNGVIGGFSRSIVCGHGDNSVRRNRFCKHKIGLQSRIATASAVARFRLRTDFNLFHGTLKITLNDLNDVVQFGGYFPAGDLRSRFWWTCRFRVLAIADCVHGSLWIVSLSYDRYIVPHRCK